MQNILTGEIIAQRDFRLSRFFFPALFPHDGGALLPQLHTSTGMDAVINAAVAGDIAPGHTTVGSVDDGITAEGGDVPLPEIYAL